MTEESTGQYADLGLQLGDQSGYELSLKEQVGQLQTLTTGNSVVSTSLSTAQNALQAIQIDSPDHARTILQVGAGRQSRRFASGHGSIGASVADQRGQRDVGGSIRIRRNQIGGLADRGLFIESHVRREDRDRPRLSDRVWRAAERPGRG